MTDEKKEFLKSEECKKLLKWMGFEWSELDEVKKLKEENRRLKEELKNNQTPKGLYSCYDCLHYEDLTGKVTWIGTPPSPRCNIGKLGFPYQGELCKDFIKFCRRIKF